MKLEKQIWNRSILSFAVSAWRCGWGTWFKLWTSAGRRSWTSSPWTFQWFQKSIFWRWISRNRFAPFPFNFWWFLNFRFWLWAPWGRSRQRMKRIFWIFESFCYSILRRWNRTSRWPSRCLNLPRRGIFLFGFLNVKKFIFIFIFIFAFPFIRFVFIIIFI